MPLLSNPDAPKNMPPIARVTIEGFTRFQDMKKYHHEECQTNVKAAMEGDMCRVSDSDAHLLRKAYHSALIFTEAQLGRVMKELKEQGLDKDTIIVLWADHGWSTTCGENSLTLKMILTFHLCCESQAWLTLRVHSLN